jgi:hypothetical protein
VRPVKMPGSYSLVKIISALFLLAGLPGLLLQPVAALESKKIYQLNENSVFQIRVLNRETGKKSSIGSMSSIKLFWNRIYFM